MRITFIFPRPKHYDSDIVRQLPSGGTEKATIFLGEAFQQLGHEVHWVTTIEQTRGLIPSTDVVIAQEAAYFEGLPEGVKKVWLAHHFVDQPIIRRNAPYYRCFGDKLVTLSQCQHDEFKTVFKLDSTIIGHGLWYDELCTTEQKDPYRLIYASTPFRGLERIPELFTTIKRAEPRATLAIASSMATYGTPEEDDRYRSIFNQLEGMDGVEMLGSLNQEQLYREYAKAGVFFYPCTWRETYCLAMDEALAHGCFPAITKIGALPERVFNMAADESILKQVDSCFKGYSDNQFVKPKSWIDIAKRWESEVLSV